MTAQHRRATTGAIARSPGGAARRPLARRLFRTVPLVLTLALTGAGAVTGCSGSSSPPAASCTGGMQSYDGHCLATTAVTYIECTKDRGFDISSQIGGAAGGTFREILGASVSLASKKSEHEDTPVALQIVKSCLTVAQAASQAVADRTISHNYLQQTNQDIDNWQKSQINATPHIKLNKSTAAIGQKVRVKGKGFWPNETVDIYVQASLVKQVLADNNGAFTTEVTVPQDAPPPGFSTTISASGESSAESAQAPFETAG